MDGADALFRQQLNAFSLPTKSISSLASTSFLNFKFQIKFPVIKFAFKKITLFPVSHEVISSVTTKFTPSNHRINQRHLLPAITRQLMRKRTYCRRRGALRITTHQPGSHHLCRWGDRIITDRSAKVQVNNGSKIWMHDTHLATTFDRHAVINGTPNVNQNGIQNRVQRG